MTDPSLEPARASAGIYAASKIAAKAAEETRRFLVMFVYLWALFGLFVLQEGIVLRKQGMGFAFQGLAIINALVLAKVMLVSEGLDLARWLRGKPLIAVILFEALILTLLFLCFHVLEHVVIGVFKGETLVASLPPVGGGGLAGLLSVAAIVFVALIPFFAFKNVSRALGPGRLEALLFKGRSEAEVD
jgi:hypothetical protein